jgi:hypothetical protein
MLSPIEAMIDGYKGVESPVIKLYERDHKSLSEIPSGNWSCGGGGGRFGRAVGRLTGQHVV